MEQEQDKKIGFGLQPLPEDKRDFSHDIVFGSAKLEELPATDFFVSEPLGIKDQGRKDFCGGYAGAEVSEDQEEVELDGDYSFMSAKELLGGESWKQWGINLRDICQAGCKVGFLEREYNPFVGTDREHDRDFLANPANWPADLKILANEHRKNSFFTVDGPYDRFDNFRSVMWQNRAEKRSILTGVKWRYSWNNAPQGIIPRTGWENDKGEGHAIKIFGQIWMDDPEKKGERTLYLVCQNSWGDKVGDGGLFYFPKEVINSQFTYGAFTFKDMPKDYAQYHSENGINVNASAFYKLLKVLYNLVLSVLGIKK